MLRPHAGLSWVGADLRKTDAVGRGALSQEEEPAPSSKRNKAWLAHVALACKQELLSLSCPFEEGKSLPAPRAVVRVTELEARQAAENPASTSDPCHRGGHLVDAKWGKGGGITRELVLLPIHLLVKY